MTDSVSRRRLATEVGALALGVVDAQRAAVDAEVGLSGEAAAALTAIGAFPGERVAFFAPILALTSAGTVRLIRRLEHRDLVKRRPGPDGRSHALHLTAAGQATAERVQTARNTVLQAALSSLDEAALQRLEAVLPKLLSALPDNRTAARRICRLCDHAACDGAGACPVDAAATAAGNPHWTAPPADP